MCVKFIKQQKEVIYDRNKPIEDQLIGSRKVVVNYDPKDTSIDSFLHEMERLCKNGTFASFDVEFNYNRDLSGFRSKKKLQEVRKGIELNEIIKLLVLMQSEADKKIDEIKKACLNRI